MKTKAVRVRLLRFVISSALVMAVASFGRSAWAQVTTAHACGSGPSANEVYVYEGPNFTGKCGALYVGFYPTSGTGTGGFGVANDSISSLIVGSSVRARLFVGPTYSANYYWFPGYGAWGAMPSGWNDVTSSIRVENNSRSITCNDLQTGEFALFRDPTYTGDCVVLHYGSNYPTPDTMGIANDTVTSVLGGPVDPYTCPSGQGSSWELQLNYGLNYGAPSYTLPSGNSNSNVSSNNMNDYTSSVSTFIICL